MNPSRHRLFVLSLLAMLLGAGGCYRMIFKEAKREDRWQKRMARGPDGADGALHAARSLVKVPITKAEHKLFRYRMMAIRSITLLMESSGYDAELDAEAHRYYEEALELGDATAAHRELARLYDRTGRRGKIAALMGESADAAPVDYDGAIRRWRSQLAKGDLAGSELTWVAAQRMASALYDVERTFAKAGTLDATAGQGGRYRLDGLDWRARYEVLRERMFAIASSNDSPTGRVEISELLQLWSQLERIGVRSADDAMGRSYGDVYRVYLDGARIFAIAGQFDAAKALLVVAERTAIGESSEFRRADLSCAEAFVATRTGAQGADALARKCLRAADRTERELELRDLVVLGEAFEHAGDLDEAERVYRRAITRAERQRDSFAVDERTVFFRTSVRRGYWGLARTLARRSIAGAGPPSDRDFVGALQAIEQVRARQLGELLEGSGQRLGKLEDLAGLRAQIGPDAVLLDYVVMDEEVMLLALTQQAQAVRFLPLDAETVGFVTTTIADALATPNSSIEQLDESLTLLGRALLLPVRELIAGKQRIVVLPDGPLNAVPFDLLDLEADRFRPLLETATVEVMPSLAFMLAPSGTRSSRGLFGVGDPVYPEFPAPSEADDPSLAAARAARAGYFVPLPETRSELQSIAQTMAGEATLLFGADARESTVKAAPLDGFGIVHFATHGILGRDVPGIEEPALVLAAESGEDGFLTATEASKLDLNARLTVLSACKTGAGDSASGEGVLGMSRAFMVAGSRSVVVSLWSVDSLSTEDLMVEFYGRMQAGEEPSAALRAAKLAVRDGTIAARSPQPAAPEPVAPVKPPRKRAKPRPTADVPRPAPPVRDHPYYWGAFIVVGR